MKNCTVCGMTVNKLEYGRLKVKTISNIQVLGETVKNKNTTLDLILCNKCRADVINDIMARVMQTKETTGCSGKCAECDGARI